MLWRRSITALVAACSFFFSVFSESAAIAGQTQSAEGTPSHSTQAQTIQPVNLNLGSVAKNVSVGRLLQDKTVQITEANIQKTIVPSALVTPAERLAIYQVISTGRQSINLGALGNAVGGTFSIGPKFNQYVSSLLIPQGVTAIQNVAKTATVALIGNLVNAGTLLAFSSNPQFNVANISAQKIINESGGVITSVAPASAQATGSFTNVDLNLFATGNIVNHGVISSSANLSIIAGGAIKNVAALNGIAPLTQAVNNLFLQSPIVVNAGSISAITGNLTVNTASLTNSGVVQALTGNTLIANNAGSTLTVNNAGGLIRAGAQLAFDTLAPPANQTGTLSLTGGTIAGGRIQFYSPAGNINVKADIINGALDVAGASADIQTAGGLLDLHSLCLSGDPVLANSGGDIDLPDVLQFSGQSLAILASGNVISGNSLAIDLSTSDPGANGGNLTIVAGYNFTPATTGQQQFSDQSLPTTFTLTGPSDTGGSVYLTNFTINTSAVGGNAGNVTVIAASGINPAVTRNEGVILLSGANSQITAHSQSGSGGNLLLIAQSDNISQTVNLGGVATPTGGNTGVSYLLSGTGSQIQYSPGQSNISIGSIDTSSAQGQPGSVVILASPPQLSGTVAFTDGQLTSGSFLPTQNSDGSVASTTSSFQATVNGATQSLAGNLNISADIESTGPLAGASIFIDGRNVQISARPSAANKITVAGDLSIFADESLSVGPGDFVAGSVTTSQSAFDPSTFLNIIDPATMITAGNIYLLSTGPVTFTGARLNSNFGDISIIGGSVGPSACCNEATTMVAVGGDVRIMSITGSINLVLSTIAAEGVNEPIPFRGGGVEITAGGKPPVDTISGLLAGQTAQLPPAVPGSSDPHNLQIDPAFGIGSNVNVVQTFSVAGQQFTATGGAVVFNFEGGTINLDSSSGGNLYLNNGAIVFTANTGSINSPNPTIYASAPAQPPALVVPQPPTQPTPPTPADVNLNGPPGLVDITSDFTGSAPVNNLVVPQGVTAVIDFGRLLAAGVSSANLGGDITNSGQIFAVSTSPTVASAIFSSSNVYNLQGGLITTVLPPSGLPGYTNLSAALSLVLLVSNNIVNSGAISSSNHLAISAGVSIINVPAQGANSASAVIQAANNLLLQSPIVGNLGQIISQSGNATIVTSQLINAATIKAIAGSVNVQTFLDDSLGNQLVNYGSSLQVDNNSGTIQASNQISFQTIDPFQSQPAAASSANVLSVVGGDLTASQINFFNPSGDVSANTNSLNGSVGVVGGNTTVVVATGNLKLSQLSADGEVLLATSSGSLDISGLFSAEPTFRTAGGDLVLLAAGDINANTAPAVALTIEAAGTTSSGEIIIAAGRQFTIGNSSLSSQNDANAQAVQAQAAQEIASSSTGSAPPASQINSPSPVGSSPPYSVSGSSGLSGSIDLGNVSLKTPGNRIELTASSTISVANIDTTGDGSGSANSVILTTDSDSTGKILLGAISTNQVDSNSTAGLVLINAMGSVQIGQSINTSASSVSAGHVTINANGSSVEIGSAGSAVNVINTSSTGGSGLTAGDINIYAPYGAVIVHGGLKSSSGPNTGFGSVFIEGSSVAVLGSIDTSSANEGGSVSITSTTAITTGDINTSGGSANGGNVNLIAGGILQPAANAEAELPAQLIPSNTPIATPLPSPITAGLITTTGSGANNAAGAVVVQAAKAIQVAGISANGVNGAAGGLVTVANVDVGGTPADSSVPAPVTGTIDVSGSPQGAFVVLAAGMDPQAEANQIEAQIQFLENMDFLSIPFDTVKTLTKMQYGLQNTAYANQIASFPPQGLTSDQQTQLSQLKTAQAQLSSQLQAQLASIDTSEQVQTLQKQANSISRKLDAEVPQLDVLNDALSSELSLDFLDQNLPYLQSIVQQRGGLLPAVESDQTQMLSLQKNILQIELQQQQHQATLPNGQPNPSAVAQIQTLSANLQKVSDNLSQITVQTPKDIASQQQLTQQISSEIPLQPVLKQEAALSQRISNIESDLQLLEKIPPTPASQTVTISVKITDLRERYLLDNLQIQAINLDIANPNNSSQISSLQASKAPFIQDQAQISNTLPQLQNALGQLNAVHLSPPPPPQPDSRTDNSIESTVQSIDLLVSDQTQHLQRDISRLNALANFNQIFHQEETYAANQQNSALAGTAGLKVGHVVPISATKAALTAATGDQLGIVSLQQSEYALLQGQVSEFNNQITTIEAKEAVLTAQRTREQTHYQQTMDSINSQLSAVTQDINAAQQQLQSATKSQAAALRVQINNDQNKIAQLNFISSAASAENQKQQQQENQTKQLLDSQKQEFQSDIQQAQAKLADLDNLGSDNPSFYQNAFQYIAGTLNSTDTSYTLLASLPGQASTISGFFEMSPPPGQAWPYITTQSFKFKQPDGFTIVSICSGCTYQQAKTIADSMGIGPDAVTNLVNSGDSFVYLLKNANHDTLSPISCDCDNPASLNGVKGFVFVPSVAPGLFCCLGVPPLFLNVNRYTDKTYDFQLFFNQLSESLPRSPQGADSSYGQQLSQIAQVLSTPRLNVPAILPPDENLLNAALAYAKQQGGLLQLQLEEAIAGGRTDDIKDALDAVQADLAASALDVLASAASLSNLRNLGTSAIQNILNNVDSKIALNSQLLTGDNLPQGGEPINVFANDSDLATQQSKLLQNLNTFRDILDGVSDEGQYAEQAQALANQFSVNLDKYTQVTQANAALLQSPDLATALNTYYIIQSAASPLYQNLQDQQSLVNNLMGSVNSNYQQMLSNQQQMAADNLQASLQTQKIPQTLSALSALGIDPVTLLSNVADDTSTFFDGKGKLTTTGLQFLSDNWSDILSANSSLIDAAKYSAFQSSMDQFNTQLGSLIKDNNTISNMGGDALRTFFNLSPGFIALTGLREAAGNQSLGNLAANQLTDAQGQYSDYAGKIWNGIPTDDSATGTDIAQGVSDFFDQLSNFSKLQETLYKTQAINYKLNTDAYNAFKDTTITVLSLELGSPASLFEGLGAEAAANLTLRQMATSIGATAAVNAGLTGGASLLENSYQSLYNGQDWSLSLSNTANSIVSAYGKGLLLGSISLGVMPAGSLFSSTASDLLSASGITTPWLNELGTQFFGGFPTSAIFMGSDAAINTAFNLLSPTNIMNGNAFNSANLTQVGNAFGEGAQEGLKIHLMFSPVMLTTGLAKADIAKTEAYESLFQNNTFRPGTEGSIPNLVDINGRPIIALTEGAQVIGQTAEGKLILNVDQSLSPNASAEGKPVEGSDATPVGNALLSIDPFAVAKVAADKTVQQLYNQYKNLDPNSAQAADILNQLNQYLKSSMLAGPQGPAQEAMIESGLADKLPVTIDNSSFAGASLTPSNLSFVVNMLEAMQGGSSATLMMAHEGTHATQALTLSALAQDPVSFLSSLQTGLGKVVGTATPRLETDTNGSLVLQPRQPLSDAAKSELLGLISQQISGFNGEASSIAVPTEAGARAALNGMQDSALVQSLGLDGAAQELMGEVGSVKTTLQTLLPSRESIQQVESNALINSAMSVAQKGLDTSVVSNNPAAEQAMYQLIQQQLSGYMGDPSTIKLPTLEEAQAAISNLSNPALKTGYADEFVFQMYQLKTNLENAAASGDPSAAPSIKGFTAAYDQAVNLLAGELSNNAGARAQYNQLVENLPAAAAGLSGGPDYAMNILETQAYGKENLVSNYRLSGDPYNALASNLSQGSQSPALDGAYAKSPQSINDTGTFLSQLESTRNAISNSAPDAHNQALQLLQTMDANGVNAGNKSFMESAVNYLINHGVVTEGEIPASLKLLIAQPNPAGSTTSANPISTTGISAQFNAAPGSDGVPPNNVVDLKAGNFAAILAGQDIPNVQAHYAKSPNSFLEGTATIGNPYDTTADGLGFKGPLTAEQKAEVAQKLVDSYSQYMTLLRDASWATGPEQEAMSKQALDYFESDLKPALQQAGFNIIDFNNDPEARFVPPNQNGAPNQEPLFQAELNKSFTFTDSAGNQIGPIDLNTRGGVRQLMLDHPQGDSLYNKLVTSNYSDNFQLPAGVKYNPQDLSSLKSLSDTSSQANQQLQGLLTDQTSLSTQERHLLTRLSVDPNSSVNLLGDNNDFSIFSTVNLPLDFKKPSIDRAMLRAEEVTHGMLPLNGNNPMSDLGQTIISDYDQGGKITQTNLQRHTVNAEFDFLGVLNEFGIHPTAAVMGQYQRGPMLEHYRGSQAQSADGAAGTGMQGNPAHIASPTGQQQAEQLVDTTGKLNGTSATALEASADQLNTNPTFFDKQSSTPVDKFGRVTGNFSSNEVLLNYNKSPEFQTKLQQFLQTYSSDSIVPANSTFTDPGSGTRVQTTDSPVLQSQVSAVLGAAQQLGIKPSDVVFERNVTTADGGSLGQVVRINTAKVTGGESVLLYSHEAGHFIDKQLPDTRAQFNQVYGQELQSPQVTDALKQLSLERGASPSLVDTQVQHEVKNLSSRNITNSQNSLYPAAGNEVFADLFKTALYEHLTYGPGNPAPDFPTLVKESGFFNDPVRAQYLSNLPQTYQYIKQSVLPQALGNQGPAAGSTPVATVVDSTARAVTMSQSALAPIVKGAVQELMGLQAPSNTSGSVGTPGQTRQAALQNAVNMAASGLLSQSQLESVVLETNSGAK